MAYKQPQGWKANFDFNRIDSQEIMKMTKEERDRWLASTKTKGKDSVGYGVQSFLKTILDGCDVDINNDDKLLEAYIHYMYDEDVAKRSARFFAEGTGSDRFSSAKNPTDYRKMVVFHKVDVLKFRNLVNKKNAEKIVELVMKLGPLEKKRFFEFDEDKLRRQVDRYLSGNVGKRRDLPALRGLKSDESDNQVPRNVKKFAQYCDSMFANLKGEEREEYIAQLMRSGAVTAFVAEISPHLKRPTDSSVEEGPPTKKPKSLNPKKANKDSPAESREEVVLFTVDLLDSDEDMGHEVEDSSSELNVGDVSMGEDNVQSASGPVDRRPKPVVIKIAKISF